MIIRESQFSMHTDEEMERMGAGDIILGISLH